MPGGTWCLMRHMAPLFRDLVFALRALRRSPVVFAAAVLTLAAGIGLATGVFAVTYEVLLRPLPYPDPERLVQVTLPRRGSEEVDNGVTLPEIEEWRRRLRAFERISASSSSDFTLRGAGEPRVVRAAHVADDFFATLAVQPVEGSSDAIRRNGASVAVSARLAGTLPGNWRVDGVTLGTRPFGVAAVMPGEFVFPAANIDVWVRADEVPPVTFFGPADQRRFRLIGRLKRDVTLEQARDDVQRTLREIDAHANPARSERVAVVHRLQERLRQDARPAVLPLLAGAALVLLIACANVSGLLVGRTVGRQAEFALRRALGGGAVHVLRASLAESLIVAFAGWAVGIWLALLVVGAFERLAAGAIPHLHVVRLDPVVIAASLALALGVALVSGAAPALRALRIAPNHALKQTSARIGRTGRTVRGALVVAQVALTIVLLVSAGLLMRTVLRIVAAERGFEARQALSLPLMLTESIRFDAKERVPFVNALVSEVRALPGVVAAGIGSDLPPAGTQVSLTIRTVTDTRDETLGLSYAAATPGFLEAIGARLVRGRLFHERDRLASPPPVVITEQTARWMFSGREAVGLEWPALLPGPAGKRTRAIVIGVIGDIKYGGLDREAPATMFGPWELLAPARAQLVVRTAGGPESIAPAVRRAVRQLDPAMPLLEARTLEEVVSGSIANRRLRLQLAATFAVLALVLAAVALWGAVAQSVLDRRHELAVRLALGSTASGAVRLMLRGGIALVAIGVLFGALGALTAARMLRHLLHGVAPGDPVVLAAAGLMAVVVSLVACYVPARRAAAVSPAELLRNH